MVIPMVFPSRQRLRTVGAGGVGSRANVSEALRAVALAKRLAQQLGQGAVAVLSWYNSQVVTGGWWDILGFNIFNLNILGLSMVIYGISMNISVM